MKVSKYNYIFSSEKFGNLLYNSETNSFAEIAESIMLYLQQGKDSGSTVENYEDSEIMEALISAKILVEENNSYFNKKKLLSNLNNFNNSVLDLTIAPTTFCNFDCIYCFEENRLPVFMSEETENRLVDFISKDENIKILNIEWYGGEPLAAFGSIKRIVEKVEKIPDIKLGSHRMITNGYLLTENKSKYFSEHPLDRIQITIDGKKDTHNKRRKLSSGGETYDKIISNVDTFIRYNTNTIVSIRVNLDSSNKYEFVEIYKELKERWYTHPKIDIYPAFVADYTDGCSSNCSIVDKNAIAEFYIDLYKTHNIPINYYPSLTVGGCGATTLNSFLVGPKGELYKCWCDIGIESKVIGYLGENKILNENVLYEYLVGYSMFDDPQCKVCEIFPICDGGCQFKRIQNCKNQNQHNLCNVRKDNLDKFLEMHYTMKLDNE